MAEETKPEVTKEKKERKSPIRSFAKKDELKKEIVKEFIEKAKLLKKGESFDATVLCTQYNLQKSLFFEIFADATIESGKVFQYHFSDDSKLKNDDVKYATLGARGSIIIKKQLVEKINESRDESEKFVENDKFDVTASGNVVTLTKI